MMRYGRPSSVVPPSRNAAIVGCASDARIRRSSRKRSRKSAASRPNPTSLIATFLWNAPSARRARWTVPIPPRPISCTSWYGPMRVPSGIVSKERMASRTPPSRGADSDSESSAATSSRSAASSPQASRRNASRSSRGMSAALPKIALDLLKRSGGHSVEMGAVLPVDSLGAHELQERLVYDGRRLERVLDPLIPHERSRAAAQIGIDERHELVEGAPVARAPGFQEPSDVAWP